MKYLVWLLKVAIFFTFFAFALNNQQIVEVNFSFGTFWRAPLVLVVFVTFGIGLGLGVLLMMPHWWKKRSQIKLLKLQTNSPAIPTDPMKLAGVKNEAASLTNISRDGL